MQLTSGGYWRASRAFIESPLAADLGVRQALATHQRHGRDAPSGHFSSDDD
jgi:hypothetical protein